MLGGRASLNTDMRWARLAPSCGPCIVHARLQVRKEMLTELARVAKEGKLKGFENIKALYLETEALRCAPAWAACQFVPAGATVAECEVGISHESTACEGVLS